MARSKANSPRLKPDGSRGARIPGLKEKLDLLLARSGYKTQLGAHNKLETIPITTFEELEDALGVYRTTLRDGWCKANRIPDQKKAKALAGYFNIPLPWLLKSLEEFVRLVDDVPYATWPHLLSLAQKDDAGKIEPLTRVMHALPESVARASHIVTIKLDSSIRATFFLPRRDITRSKTGQLHWDDWHAIVLSEDLTGCLCLFPRYAQDLNLPPELKGPGPLILDLRVDTTGPCSLILIAARNPLPNEISRMLQEDRQGTTFQPVLDKLALFLLNHCPGDKVAVSQLRYLVTA